MSRGTDLIERLAAARPASLNPVPDAARRSRDLQTALDFEAAATPARRRVGRRTVFMVGLLAAGTAAAIAFTTVAPGSPSGPAPSSPAAPPGTQRMSARQVLLAAAATAEKQPATDGAYWRVRVLDDFWVHWKGLHRGIEEHWHGKDGSFWTGLRKVSGPWKMKPSISRGPSSTGFSLSDQPLTLAQIQGLPADQVGLTRWLEKFVRGETFGRTDFVTGMLIDLLSATPTPPRVRAAAFRALADRPGVKGGGTATDPIRRTGRLIEFGGMRYIIDPNTTLLLSESNRNTSAASKKIWRTRTYLEMTWTNDKPHIPNPF